MGALAEVFGVVLVQWALSGLETAVKLRGRLAGGGLGGIPDGRVEIDFLRVKNRVSIWLEILWFGGGDKDGTVAFRALRFFAGIVVGSVDFLIAFFAAKLNH